MCERLLGSSWNGGHQSLLFTFSGVKFTEGRISANTEEAETLRKKKRKETNFYLPHVDSRFL